MIYFQVKRNNDLDCIIKIDEDADIHQMFDMFYSQLLALGFTFGTIQDKIMHDADLMSSSKLNDD